MHGTPTEQHRMFFCLSTCQIMNSVYAQNQKSQIFFSWWEGSRNLSILYIWRVCDWFTCWLGKCCCKCVFMGPLRSNDPKMGILICRLNTTSMAAGMISVPLAVPNLMWHSADRQRQQCCFLTVLFLIGAWRPTCIDSLGVHDAFLLFCQILTLIELLHCLLFYILFICVF